MTIILRSDFDVALVYHSGSDEDICKAARVSTLGSESLETDVSKGLIRFLMNNRHGSPFEHGSMTFLIRAPIFVWREFMRHRIGVSYNEESGRYRELSPEFYIPNLDRPLQQVGKPGAYTFEAGTSEQNNAVAWALSESYGVSWGSYQAMLSLGVAKEVARFCLPVATYSSAYVTFNPRSLMHFLSLRTKHEDSKFPSYPQYEINRVANQIEDIYRGLFPIVHEAFNNAGRVCP